MDISAITAVIFGASFAVGAIAYMRTAHLGKKASAPMRKLMRLVFGACVGLAAWSCSAFGLWIIGIELKIGTILSGRMAETWWLGPFCIFWSILAYLSLRSDTE